MKTISKFSVTGRAGKLDVPEGWKPVYVDYDGDGCLCIWAKVNTNKETVRIYYEVIETDSELVYHSENAMKYVGTAIEPSGFVWHVYVSKKTPKPKP